MHELGRARARAACPVVHLDDADAEAAGCRIKGGTGTVDSAADDEDVEGVVGARRGKLLEVCGTRAGIECGAGG